MRRQLFLRPGQKDESPFRRSLVGGGIVGSNRRSWHKVAESRIKENIKGLKSESRIIKHNVEKSQQLLSGENDVEIKPSAPLRRTNDVESVMEPEYSSAEPPPAHCTRQVTMESNICDDKKLTCYGQPSPELSGNEVVYQAFYPDEPLDIIQSLLVAKSSDVPAMKVEDECSSLLPSEALEQTGSSQEIGEQEHFIHERAKEDTASDTGEVASWKAPVEETPRRGRFAEELPLSRVFNKQGRKARSLSLGRINSQLAKSDSSDRGPEKRSAKEQILEFQQSLSSAEAENIEQPLLDLLNARLQALSTKKLKYLLKVMDKLDGDLGACGKLPEGAAEQEHSEGPTGCPSNTITLRVLSSWGNQEFVGLVEVALFDKHGTKILLHSTQLSSNASSSTLGRIVDGAKGGKQSWECPLPPPGSSPLEICIRLPSKDTVVSHVELWNSSTTNAVREMQIMVNGEAVWQGTVPNDRPCTTIFLPFSKDQTSLEGALHQNYSSPLTDPLLSDAASLVFDDDTRAIQMDCDEPDLSESRGQQLKADHIDFQDIERFVNAEYEGNWDFHYHPHVEIDAAEYHQDVPRTKDQEADGLNLYASPGHLEQMATQRTTSQTELPVSGMPELMQVVKPAKNFAVPLLPQGTKLTINIHSTWGDPHYIGLSGIEVFNDLGQLVHIEGRKQIKVSLTNSSLLSGSCHNPLFVERLVDNVNMTCDDSHMWLAPFSLGQPCSIGIWLEKPTTIGMIRFWNYNKSIIHSFRGARMASLLLDSQLIFSGELRKASGLLSDAFKHVEPILFTEDEAAISTIELYDMQYLQKVSHEESLDEFHTASRTSESCPADLLFSEAKRPEPSPSGRCEIAGRVLKLKLLRSWGDTYYFGLTGIQVLDGDGIGHKIQPEFMTAKPRDLNDIPGHKGDYRTLDKLVDGCNLTTDDRHMWLVPYDGPEAEHYLQIEFPSPIRMAALRIWNYNKSLDDTFRGVKWIRAFIDGKEVSPSGGFLLRKAPGIDKFDFGQVLPLSRKCNKNLELLKKHKYRDQAILKRIISDMVQQEYLTPLLPCGHVIKFSLISTWGDHQYVGLNGIELHDEMGQLVPIAPHNIYVMPDMATHFSNPEKLFNGINNTWDTQSMWLSVLDYNNGNNIYLHFNDPIMLSYVRIWNYSRNPVFGVRELEIFVDDLLIYKGYVRKAISANSKHLVETQNFPQSIIFTNDEKLVQTNQDHVFYCGGIPNSDVVLINDNYVVSDASYLP